MEVLLILYFFDIFRYMYNFPIIKEENYGRVDARKSDVLYKSTESVCTDKNKYYCYIFD